MAKTDAKPALDRHVCACGKEIGGRANFDRHKRTCKKREAKKGREATADPYEMMVMNDKWVPVGTASVLVHRRGGR